MLYSYATDAPAEKSNLFLAILDSYITYCTIIFRLSINMFLHYIYSYLTHWRRMMYIWVSSYTIGPDNVLSPGRCQGISLANAGILLSGP